MEDNNSGKVLEIASFNNNVTKEQQDTRIKLRRFLAAKGTYTPVIGDLVRALPNAYTGKFTSKRECIVTEVLDESRVCNEYKPGVTYTYLERLDMRVAIVDDDGDIIEFDVNSAYFEKVRE